MLQFSCKSRYCCGAACLAIWGPFGVDVGDILVHPWCLELGLLYLYMPTSIDTYTRTPTLPLPFPLPLLLSLPLLPVTPSSGLHLLPAQELQRAPCENFIRRSRARHTPTSPHTHSNSHSHSHSHSAQAQPPTPAPIPQPRNSCARLAKPFFSCTLGD